MMTTNGQIRITPEDGRRLIAAVRQAMTASPPVGEEPDRPLPDGYRWVQGANGSWAPRVDELAC